MFVRLFPFALSVALLLSSTAGFAADAPTLRGSDQDGYSRMVLDFGAGQTPPAIKVEPAGATGLTLSFAANTAPAVPDLDLKAIDSVKAAADQGTVRLTLTRPADAKYRTLTIANRQIIDVYHAAAPAKETVSQPAVSPAAAPPPVATPPAAPQTQDIGLNITLSEAAGVSVFQRADALYVVLDIADVAIPPQITAGGQQVFGPATRIEAPEATIFRLPILQMPKVAALNMIGDGAGLIWRVNWQAGSPPATHLPTGVETVSKPAGMLVWPATLTRKVVTFEDPVMGDRLFAVTVSDAKQFGGADMLRTPQVTVLPSAIGLGGALQADDVSAVILPDKTVHVTRPNGLFLRGEETQPVESEAPEGAQAGQQPGKPDAKSGGRFFQLERWAMGDASKLRANHIALIMQAGAAEGPARAQALLKLAQLHLAHGQGTEAQGLLQLAEDTYPALAQTPNYMALRGAAAVMAGQNDRAIPFLFAPQLDNLSDIKVWRAAALAGLGDWGQASQFLPIMPDALKGYTPTIKDDLSLILSEVALRDGAIQQAQMLMEPIAAHRTELSSYDGAYLSYLEGEVARQAGDKTRAAELWDKLIKGREDYFRVRAGLALVVLKDQDKQIKPEEAIDILESLRYAWRGDELEIDVASKLGEMYIAKKEYLRGLAILRSAAGVTGFPRASERIAVRMNEVYADLLSEKGIAALTPVQALTLYREFGELMPTGAEGDAMLRTLADTLMDAGMIEPAQELLNQQGKKATTPTDMLRIQMRLAALALQESNPESALSHLALADKQIATMDVTAAAPKARDVSFMRAQAYVQQDKTEEALRALSLLQQDQDVLRMRADIAWKSSKWKEAAEALEQLVAQEILPDTRPINEAQANLILNWAVALNLSGNRFVLSTMRERYGDMMLQTDKSKQFEVVTRPRQNVVLSDRETIQGMVSEVSLFKDFLDSYAKSTAEEKPATPAPEPVPPTAAAAPQVPPPVQGQ
ncbi:MAG: hypothetical protein V4621_04270 [Pseudomonadota bacterium]